MPAPRKTVEINAVKKALDVWGLGGRSAGKKFIELVQKIEQLDDGEILVRVRDLTEEHIGATLQLKGQTYILNDIDFGTTRQSRTDYRRLPVVDEGDETDATDTYHYENSTFRRIRSPHDSVMLVLDSKLWHLHKNSIVTLSNLSS